MDAFRAYCFTTLFLSGVTIKSSRRAFTPPRIFPRETEYTLRPNDNFTLRCEGKEPVTWRPPNNTLLELQQSPLPKQLPEIQPKYSTVTISASKTEDLEYIYGSILTIQNASYWDVGFYYCLGENSDIEDLFRVSNIYIYVNDPKQLSVLPPQQFMDVTLHSEVILPCRPTSSSVHVELIPSWTNDTPKILLDTPDSEGRVVTYDRRKGFIINQFYDLIYFCRCVFSRDYYRFTSFIKLNGRELSQTIVKPLLEELTDGHTVVGEKLILKCTMRNMSPLMRMSWIVPDQNALTNGRVSMSKNVRELRESYYQELTIHETTLNDQGEYMCVVKYKYDDDNDENIDENEYIKEDEYYYDDGYEIIGEDGTNHTKFIKIYDKGEHFINLIAENEVYGISVLAGEPRVQWRIGVEAHPLPSLVWYHHNGNKIPAGWSDSNKYKVNTEGLTETTLVINNITIQDRGVYQLKVINDYEEKVLNLSLNVIGKPTVQIQTKNFHMNKPSTLECLVIAYPEPTIRWFYRDCQDDSCEFQPQSPLRTVIGMLSKSYLNIAANQSGYVKCIANNSMGLDESAVGLFTTANRKFTPPRIFPEEAEYTLRPNDNFTLRCEGKEPVTWRLPNNTLELLNIIDLTNSFIRPVRSKPKYSIITLHSSETDDSEYIYGSILTIQNVEYLDVGFYYCSGETADLEDRSRVANTYIYVDDPEELSVVLDGNNLYIWEVPKYSEVIVPCRPTSSNVHVILRDNMRMKNILLNTPDSEGKVVTFDRRKGFTINQFSYDNYIKWSCQFFRNDSQLLIGYYIEIYPSNDLIGKPFLEELSGGHTVVGKTLILKCTIRYEMVPQCDMEWIVPDQNGIKNGRIRVSNTIKGPHNTFYQELTITKTTVEDQGAYVCVVKAFRNKNNHTKFIQIHDKDEYFINLTQENGVYEFSVESGGPCVQFRIDVKANPFPKLAWYNQKDEFIPELETGGNLRSLYMFLPKYEVSTNNYSRTTLVINNITIQDGGVYQLKAKNDVEEKVLHLSLTVNDKPFVQIQKENFHMLNEPSTVKCLVVANPQPTICWSYKYCLDDSCDFEPLPTLREEMGIFSKSYLNITTSQSGYVKCKANNSLGADESVVGFLVTDLSNGFGIWGLDKGTIEEVNGTFQFPLAVGENITLYCAASRYNYTDQLTWFKDVKYGTISLENNNHYIIQKNKTKYSNTIALSIRSANFEDSGNYVCQTEIINMPSSQRFLFDNITVIFRNPELPIITKTNLNDAEYFINYRDRFELWCYAKGLPKPTITWYKDGEAVIETKTNKNITVEENNCKLILQHTESKDEGSYVCRASNNVGTIEKRMKLLLKNKPEIIYKDNINLDKSGINHKFVLLILLAIGFLFIPLSLYPFLRFRKERELRKKLNWAGLENFENGALEILNPELGVDDQAELLPYDKIWEFPRHNLKLGKKLGSGAFGVVMKAEAADLTTGEESTTVAVKMVKRSTDCAFIKALCSELKIMVHMGKHLNVVNLLGACTKNIAKGELLVIVEYCRYGNLHNYLLLHRESFINQIDAKTGNIDYAIGAEMLERSFSVLSTENSLPNGNLEDYKENVKHICTKDLIIWAFQVARGMEYLASRKVLHGDLAARNILLADYNVVKICDFGLAKSMNENDNYKKKNSGLLPLKWMAVESITDRIFSTQSDVWSFGIVLWEFFSLARTPYPDMEADEKLCNKLVDGYRMDSPEFATDEIYTMMCECWDSKPLRRPSFTTLVETIGCFLGRNEKQHYIDLNDPYLSMNTQRLETGQSDYLAMLSPPDFGHRSSSIPYANDDVLPNANPIQVPGYLCMKPSHILSPQVNEEDVITCAVENCNRKHKNSLGEIPSGIEFVPTLSKQNEKYVKPTNC